MPTGTISDPFTFASVIGGTSGALPGSIFRLKPGTYNPPGSAAWNCMLNGSAIAPFTFIGQPGVTIGPISINGQYTIWQDCDFGWNGWTTRYSSQPGSNPTNEFGWARFICAGKGTILRRCTIHDFADVGWGIGASDSLWEDCISYNNGWDADDRAHGHGFYIQNDNQGPKTMRRHVSLMNYATPGKIFTATSAALENVTLEDCVLGIAKEAYTYVQSTEGQAHNISLRNIYSYGVTWKHDCGVAGGGPLSVDGGVIAPSLSVDWYAYDAFDNWQNGATVKNLQIIGRRAVSVWPGTTPAGAIDYNAYHIIPPSGENVPFTEYGGAPYTSMAAWSAATGNDAHSTYSTSYPADRVITIPRGADTIVVVYNWSGAATLAAPVAGTYINLQNPAESVVKAAGAALSMSGWTARTPTGASGPVLPVTFPTFGCFRVVP